MPPCPIWGLSAWARDVHARAPARAWAWPMTGAFLVGSVMALWLIVDAQFGDLARSHAQYKVLIRASDCWRALRATGAISC